MGTYTLIFAWIISAIVGSLIGKLIFGGEKSKSFSSLTKLDQDFLASRAASKVILQQNEEKKFKADCESTRNMVGSLIRDGWANRDLLMLPDSLRIGELSLFRHRSTDDGFLYPPFFNEASLDAIRAEVESRKLAASTNATPNTVRIDWIGTSTTKPKKAKSRVK